MRLYSRFALRCGVLLVLLFFRSVEPTAATNLTGTFKHPDGSPVNGKLVFLLSQPARLSDQSAQVVPMVKIFSVTNGQLEANAFVYGNDVLVPSGTYYLVRLVDLSNNLIFEQKWSIQGTNLNLGTLTPTTTGIVLPDPLIKNATSEQAVEGPVSFNSELTAFSLKLNGNLSPTTTDVNDLGSSSAAWRELYARRWGVFVTPGGLGATAYPPNAQPSVTTSLTGGSIADGTYYVKLTYFNRNGETTASPARTISISGGGGAARITVWPGDSEWITGTYAFYVYVSNDGTTFYRQTPSPVGGNMGFMANAQGHYVTGGTVGAYITSLTFSGTQLPSSNTAAIDPLQVAVNAAYNSTSLYGTGVVVVGGATGTLLTTPLILSRQVKLIAPQGTYGTVQAGSLIAGNWADAKTATVMVINCMSVGMDGINITNYLGNALMLLGQSGGSDYFNFTNGSIISSDATNTYHAVEFRGVFYHHTFKNTYMRGGRSVVHFVHHSGGEFYFEGPRWDAGGSSVVWSEPSYTDPDLNANIGAFPNGVAGLVFENLLIEQGSGILWDMVNAGATWRNVQTADLTTLAGTDRLVNLGVNSTYGSSVPTYHLDNSQLGSSANARVGAFLNGSGGNSATIALIGNSSIGYGTSTGQSITLDANNTSPRIMIYGGNDFAVPMNFDTGATSGKVINLGVNAVLNVFGQGAGTSPNFRWNEIPQRLVISSHSGSNPDRSNRRSIFNNGGVFEFRANDDTTVVADITNVGNVRTKGTLKPMTSGLALGDVTTPWAGAFSTGTFSGQITSTLTSGTAPFNIASTTEVSNLNSQQWHGKQAVDFSGSLDFGSIAAQACAELTLTASGAVTNSPVAPSWPASLESALTGIMYVSAGDTVTVRLCNITAAAVDPAIRTFSGRVIK